MLYFLNYAYTPNTAVANRMLGYYAAMDRMGIKADIVYLIPNLKRDTISAQYKNIQVKYMWGKNDNYTNKILRYINTSRNLKKFIKTLKAGDIVYTHGITIATTKLLKVKGIKVFAEKTEHFSITSGGRISSLSQDEIIDVAKRLDNTDSKERMKILDGKIMTSIFFEPSTRTRLSFTSAAYKMGCKELGFDNPDKSSIMKGESLRDTIIMVSAYSDVIVMRHNIDGAARFAEEVTDCPIINAGDGSNEHPSQTLLDLYTLREELGSIENKKIAFVGDTKYGRTVHSLAKALKRFNGEFYFISPDIIQIPDYILKELDKSQIKYKKLNNYEEILKDVDCLYMTRIQKERFDDIQEFEKVKHAFNISRATIEGKCKDDMIIMHPLPRVDEINIDLDDTKYAKYFVQARNGVPTRMAMLAIASGVIELTSKRKEKPYPIVENKEMLCTNSKCVTHFEKTKNKVMKRSYGDFCYYCNREIGK